MEAGGGEPWPQRLQGRVGMNRSSQIQRSCIRRAPGLQSWFQDVSCRWRDTWGHIAAFLHSDAPHNTLLFPPCEPHTDSISPRRLAPWLALWVP